ncbi:hypothetical protein [Cohnella lupini]|uniref:Flp pilus-assembly TadE/G-like protein n=1 Tax=Cohnella lupini TaxID=1294267 RepID=A0A3D9IMT2_9BACL|nr:hypothetical protein [Cohnella lupini]RED63018.1 hypothetical protein DFP95_10411 [Cohnella lupini]
MKVFKRNQRGSVSVFLISIVAAVFLFNAVLIDFARIQAAKRQSDMVVQAAVRSVLGAFDKNLHGKYGLFGVDKDKLEPLLTDILKQNLRSTPTEDSFQLIDTALSGSPVLEASGDLGNQVILQQQILEDMKYKAPIEITVELFDKFKKLATVMKTASAATKASKEMKKEYLAREKSFEQYWELRDQMKDLNVKLDPLTLLTGSSELSSIHNLGGIANHYDYIRHRYIEIQGWEQAQIDKETSIVSLESARSSLSSQRSALISNAEEDEVVDTSELDNQIASLSTDISRLVDEINELKLKIRATIAVVNPYLSQSHQLLQNITGKIDQIVQLSLDAEEELNSARKHNQSMREAFDKAMAATKEGNYDKVAKAPDSAGNVANDDMKAVESGLDQIVQDLEKTILPDTHFETIKKDIVEERTKLAAVSLITKELSSSMPTQYSSTGVPPSTSEIHSFASEIHNTYKGVEGAINTHSDPNSYPEEKKRMEDKANYDNKSGETNEAAGKASLGEVLGIINAIKLVDSSIDDYKDLGGFYKNYIAQQAEDTDKGAVATSNDLDDAGGDAMSMMDSLFEGLGNFFETMRNELYVNEYAFQRFDSFDGSALLKKPVDLTKLDETIAPFVNVNGSGLEYIIYGLESPGANIGAAYGELFLVRLALRTLEGFTNSAVRALGHPLLVLIAAIAYGVIHALSDMYQFFMGQQVELIQIQGKKLFQLSYKDYLRLFLLLHSSEKKKLARIQALIQFNLPGQKPLTDYQSYVTAQAEFSVRLWFLPGVMEALNQTVQLNGRVQGSRYYYDSGQRFMSY